MLRWIDVIRFANQGNPKPDKVVEKSEAEWKAQLTPEQFYVTRQKGTERAFSSEMCSRFEPGQYACVCCDTLLFDSDEKFESGTGWPSFTQPAKENAIAYHIDNAYGMKRVETVCNTCGAHLGHVFPDGPAPSGLRYCMNAVALQKVEATTTLEKATFGGGCFWCTEAIFQDLEGVTSVVSGYSDGQLPNPTYKEVCSGRTGHAEVVQITFDPEKISYADLLRIHLTTHDPTTLNRQGADVGTQYRSTILTHNDMQRAEALKIIEEIQPNLEEKIVTDVKPFEVFYPAEAYHQNYYRNNPGQGYCAAVISPKLAKFRKLYQSRLKKASVAE
ncbi:peptide methionine sulfoxide reductase msrA/msrB [Catalinimonas alkaloidigena]|uniref:Peptide methionine sulfoxide reductase MsrA n=1 Tax=Catalinimonas alkaloidigena TaxID=1075417 RepID=A0A1G8ZWM1_9BACT|nr:bifunctional methionine sulfoxide reductase B/A protein [Catalinimonas alkaloidigena]SDK19357.1 peptide methionine sulfoxide reductase msrA/msrB [Catalinimonas alkaloidigena]